MRPYCLVITPEVRKLIDKIKEKYPERYSQILDSAKDEPSGMILVNNAVKADIEAVSSRINGAVPTFDQMKKYLESKNKTPLFQGFSGHADGSDMQWANTGEKFGIKTVHFRPWHITDENLAEATLAVEKANKILDRHFPTKSKEGDKLILRDYLQVKEADAVFAIGDFITTKNYDVVVDGGTGWAVQMAIDMGKPVHIFSQKEGVWYTKDNGVWVKEDTPILTSKYAGIGTRNITIAGRKAIEEVFEKTLPKDKSYLEEEADNMEDLEQQAVMSFTSTQQRMDRATLIARIFSSITTQEYDKALATNPNLKRKEFILGNLSLIITQTYNFFNNNPKWDDYRNQAFKQVQDNWRVLLEEASDFIYGIEGIELSSPRDIEEVTDFDDEENSYISKDGWMVKAREVNLKETLSVQVRKILSSIVKRRKIRSGETSDSKTPGYIIDTDDLGLPRFLNPDYAHIKLMEALSGIYSSDEFDKTLQNLVKKQPWVSQIIATLNADTNDLKALFYNDLRREFVPYWIQVDDKTKQINRHPGIYYLFAEWRNNYESGIKLNEDSIYNERNQIIPEAGKLGLEIASSLLNDLTEIDKSDRDEIAEFTSNNAIIIQKLLAMIGIDFSTEDIVDTIMVTENPVNTIKTIVNQCSIVFMDASKGEISDNADFINEYDGVYTTIANLFNIIPEGASLVSFREAGKTYQSFSAPSYLGRLLNGIKSPIKWAEVMQKEFGDYRQFFANGKYRNEWLRLLQSPEYRALLDRKVVLHKDKKEFDDWTAAQHMIAQVNEFFSIPSTEGTTPAAYYALPLLADAGSAEFIKFVKYISDEKGSVESKILPLLAEEVLNEYERIRVVEKRDLDRRSGISSSEVIYNYDILRDQQGNIIGPNGAEFKFFPVLNTWVATDKFISEHPQYSFIKEGNSFREALDTITNNHRELLNLFVRNVLVEVEEDAFQRFYKEARLTFGTKSEEGFIEPKSIRENSTFEADMREYFYNNAFAYTQMVRLTTTDLAFYKDLNDFQKRYKEVYGMTLRLYTNSKYGKKIRKSIYLKDNIIVSKSYNVIKAIINGRQDLSKQEKDYILSQYKKVNVADAQTFITLDSYRSIMSMCGRWTEEMQESYERLEDGSWEFKDFETIWQTIKSFMFTQNGVDSKTTFKKEGTEISYGKIKVPMQMKTSEALLMAIYSQIAENVAQSDVLRGLNKWMKERDIDAATFESGIKAGNQGPIGLDDADIEAELNRLRESKENVNPTIEDAVYSILERSAFPNDLENAEVVHSTDYEDYGIQVATSEHILDHEDVIGAQIKKLIEADLPDDILVEIPGLKKKLNKSELHNLYQSLLTENILDGFTRISEKFLDEYGQPNYEEIEKLIKKEMAGNTRYTDEDRKACTLVERNGKKVFNISLFDPIQSERIQQMLFSIIKKNVTKQTIKRATAIQATSFGLTDELQIRYKDSTGKIITDQKVIESMSENEKKLSIAYYEAYLPAYSKKFFEPLLDKDGNLDINKLPDDLRRIIGFRTPTEAKYSMQPIYIKGFLPVSMGSVIMLPAEITTIVGSDFDVDKVLCMLPEFDIIKYDLKQAKYYYNKEVIEPNKVDSEVAKLLEAIVYSDEATRITGKSKAELDTLDDNTLTEILDSTNDLLLNDLSEEVISFKIWFNQNKERFQYETPIIRKVRYDYSKPANQQGPSKLARRRRNNAIIDVAWGILTNEKIAPQVLKPGGFDEASRIAALCTILSNVSLKDIKTITGTSTFKEAMKVLMGYNKDQMKKISKKYSIPLDPLSPLTQIFFHQQNANGGKMIGVYAVDVSAHAEGQWCNLELKQPVFMFGKSFQKIDRILNDEGQLISENLSNFLAASVDNVKDPVLKALNQNGNTGAMTSLLLRLGLTIPEIGLFMTAPLISKVDPNYKSNRELTIDSLAWLINMYNNKDSFASLSEENKVYYYELLNSVRVKYDELSPSAEALKFITSCSRGDTSNSAGGPTFGHVVLRYLKLKKLQESLKTEGFPINADILNLDFILDDNYTNMDECYDSGVPFLQAATKCGVVGPMYLMRQFFPQLKPQILSLLTDKNSGLAKYIDFTNEKMSEERAVKYMNKFFNELFVYILSSTEFFGKNGTSDSARVNYQQYALYFPEYFDKIRREFTDLKSNQFIKQLKVSFSNIYNAVPSIKMSNTGNMSKQMSSRITRDWESLLNHPNEKVRKLGIQLFKYAQMYGLSFTGPHRFVQLVPNVIKEITPDYLSCLESLITDSNFNFTPFLNQFIRNNITSGDFTYPITDKVIKFKQDDIIETPIALAYNNFLNYYNKETQEIEYYQLLEKDDSRGVAIYTRIFPLGTASGLREYYYGVGFAESALPRHTTKRTTSQYSLEDAAEDYSAMGYTVMEEESDYTTIAGEGQDYDQIKDATNQNICK